MAKILIVDDDPVARDILAEVVEAMGHSVLLSPDGAHALKTLQCDRRVAMLVTDMAMPEMDGRELIRAAHKVPAHSKLPIAIMSGVVGPKEIADLLREGAETFLPKPVKLAELRECVVSIIGAR
ncbi:MAG: response regulator [Deltaproteobacteria bacterium]|nr:response regulator [Deltaproteobacteria bacterium]